MSSKSLGGAGPIHLSYPTTKGVAQLTARSSRRWHQFSAYERCHHPSPDPRIISSNTPRRTGARTVRPRPDVPVVQYHLERRNMAASASQECSRIWQDVLFFFYQHVEGACVTCRHEIAPTRPGRSQQGRKGYPTASIICYEYIHNGYYYNRDSFKRPGCC